MGQVSRLAVLSFIVVSTASCAGIERSTDNIRRSTENVREAADRAVQMATELKTASKELDPLAYKLWTERLFTLLEQNRSLEDSLEIAQRDLELVKKNVVFMEIEYSVAFANVVVAIVGPSGPIGRPWTQIDSPFGTDEGRLRLTSTVAEIYKLAYNQEYTLRVHANPDDGNRNWHATVTVFEVRGSESERIPTFRVVRGYSNTSGEEFDVDIPFQLIKTFAAEKPE